MKRAGRVDSIRPAPSISTLSSPGDIRPLQSPCSPRSQHYPQLLGENRPSLWIIKSSPSFDALDPVLKLGDLGVVPGDLKGKDA